MSAVVPRTCTEIREDDAELSDGRASRPLESFREGSVYVLLGDPGAGKSTMFDSECRASGDGACLVTARDLVAFDVQSHPDWRGKTLFIDGLDEVRAGSADVLTPFDAIRRKLDQLGRPRFRLSCREADWLGINDRSNLARVAPDGRVVVLRLDPLTDEDVERILDSHSAVDDAGQFMELAREKGVDGFLRNPQSLGLLVRVVGGSRKWPASRQELLDAACRQMVREHNDEHVAAVQSLVSALAVADGLTEEVLLDAAGRLCAVQLVAGVAGFAVTENDRTDHYPAIDACCQGWNGPHAAGWHPGVRVGPLRAVLATKLFTAHATGRFGPVHRHVAEFLGGRYLARLIGDNGLHYGAAHGVPFRRVGRLMTGCDGMVVTALRGLSAWLAAQSMIARGDLIERDPVGVTLYGDAASFSTEEKRSLLKSLAQSSGALAERLEASFCYPAQAVSAAASLVATVVEPQQPLAQISAAGSLVTTDTEPTIREILTDPRRDDAYQTFVLFVLRALPHGARLQGLNGALLEVVRGVGWWPGVTRRAVDALLHNRDGRGDSGFVDSLKALLADVRAARVPDPQGDLAGRLLHEFYPGKLSPAEVWDHLSESEAPPAGGLNWRFWMDRMAKECPAADIAIHLDQLVARREVLRPVLESRHLQEVSIGLLARGLEAHGEGLDGSRLYDWLGVGLTSESSTAYSTGATRGRIRSWLAQRPASLQAVLDEGLRRLAAEDGDEIHRRLWLEVGRRLYPADLSPADLPEDFGFWCLDRAQALACERPPLARALLRRAMNAAGRRTGDDRLSIALLEARVRADADIGAIYAELQAGDGEARREIARYERDRQRHEDEQEWEHRQKIDYVRAHEAALRDNRCPPALLHQLALAYFGLLIEADGNTPTDRLRSLFRNDERLTEAALVGLRDVIFRADLPDIDEVLRLQDQNRKHFLALPALASLEELEKSAPDELERLDADLTRKALAFHYCTHGLDEPGWFRRILGLRPELVAEVLIRCAAPALRNGREHVSGLHQLAYDQEHAQVARLVSLPLLRAFPIRCAARQMTDLSWLLWSALLHTGRDALSELVAEKLSRQSMDVAQRARWLAAGLSHAPKTYLAPAEEFAAGGERRIRHLFALFDDQPLRLFPMERLSVPALKLVIRLAGSTYLPRAAAATGEATAVTPEMNAAERVQWMIPGLAELPTAEAGTALEALASDPALVHWRPELIRARDDQRVIRRDAAYRHPDVEQVCRTLSDGPPANAGDLAALLIDRLDEIADRIRNGNTDDWRQYWNEDSYGHATAPKPENSCRDALLSALRQRLPQEVDAQPEGHYANDKRADIRIACREFQVPVEVKKDAHPKLWSALRDQLIAQYVRDPGTDGYGIYLVLWFSDSGEHGRGRMPPPPTGALPRSPGELQERLEATLTRDEKRKIAVCVMDVSPGGRGSQAPAAP